jgi:hypothetical protein
LANPTRRRPTSERVSLAEALLEHETLDEDDAYGAAGVRTPEAPPAEPHPVAAR